MPQAVARKLTHTSSGVVHHTPKRTRLKLPKQFRNQGRLSKVKSSLKDVPGIESVDVNDRTGSIIVNHNQDHKIFDVLMKTFSASGTDVLEALTTEEALGEAGLVALAVGAATNLFKSATDNLTSEDGKLLPPSEKIKRILPLAFFGAGVYRYIKTEALIEGMAPLVLFYWAWDSYWKYCDSPPATKAGSGRSKNGG